MACGRREISCAEIENIVEAIEGVIECVTFGQQTESGEEQAYICIVSSVSNIENKVRKQLCVYYPVLKEVRIQVYEKHFFRNENGKIDIERLKKRSNSYDC